MVGAGSPATTPPGRQVANVILLPSPEDVRDPDLPLCRGPARVEDFLTRARQALGLLTAQQGCLSGQLGRSRTTPPLDAERGFGSADR